MRGTELAYGGTRCAVLRWRMVVRDVRYRASVWCYAMRGTELAYGATRCAVLSARMQEGNRIVEQWLRTMPPSSTRYPNGHTLAQYRTPHSTIR
eukprot:802267-Rhodomonas_salina.1